MTLTPSVERPQEGLDPIEDAQALAYAMVMHELRKVASGEFELRGSHFVEGQIRRFKLRVRVEALPL